MPCCCFPLLSISTLPLRPISPPCFCARYLLPPTNERTARAPYAHFTPAQVVSSAENARRLAEVEAQILQVGFEAMCVCHARRVCAVEGAGAEAQEYYRCKRGRYEKLWNLAQQTC